MPDVHICNVRLMPDYRHTIYFASQADQYAYFDNHIIKSYYDYTTVRKSENIQVKATMEQARAWSYLYKVNDTSGQRNFYFITEQEFLNPHTVELTLELDVMQTYMFNTSLTECFVEREHVDQDVPGQHILAEGLETGEYVITDEANANIGELCVMVASSLDLDTVTEESDVPAAGAVYNGVFSALCLYAVKKTDIGVLVTALNRLDEWGKSDCILSMWMYPINLVQTSDDWSANVHIHKVVKATTKDGTINRPTQLGRYVPYTPRNKKLLAFPYALLYLTNNHGSAAIYHFERFDNSNEPVLRVVGSLSPDGAAHIYPVSYNGKIINYEEGVTLGGYPSCAWNQDSYKLWLAQNQGQQIAGYTSAAVMLGAGVATSFAGGGVGAAAGAGMIWGGLQQIGDLMAAHHDKQVQPPQSKGQFSSSVGVAAEHHNFSAMVKTIDEQHARVLDDYFDMYGYKCQRVKTPAKNHRPHYWYTKTIGCHVVGSANAAERAQIARIYDNGITFWRDGDQIGNYGLDNRV